jgi:hypothetical protein
MIQARLRDPDFGTQRNCNQHKTRNETNRHDQGQKLPQAAGLFRGLVPTSNILFWHDFTPEQSSLRGMSNGYANDKKSLSEGSILVR